MVWSWFLACSINSKFPASSYNILSLLMGMIKHSQYLYNISKKNLGMESIFCMQISWHLYKLALSVLTEMARHVQSTQNRKLVIFLQYIKKKMSQLHMFSIVMENIQIFYGGPVMFVATCSVAMLLLSLKQVFWNKSVFYNIITNSKIPK